MEMVHACGSGDAVELHADSVDNIHPVLVQPGTPLGLFALASGKVSKSKDQRECDIYRLDPLADVFAYTSGEIDSGTGAKMTLPISPACPRT